MVTEFDRYIMEHPDMADMIPKNVQIVLHVEGETEYNEWSKKLAENPPVHSRLIAPVVCQSA